MHILNQQFFIFFIALLVACIRANEDEDSDIKPEFCNRKPLYNPHPTNCGKYIICAGPIGVHILSCPDGLHWDNKRELCNWKKFAGCDGTTQPKTTTKPSHGLSTDAPKRTTEQVTSSIVTKGSYEQAEPCDTNLCKLPTCACAESRVPPKDLPSKNIPQMILITWEDGINDATFQLFNELFDNKVNPNGCPIKSTFFVPDINNNYDLTHKLYLRGHEIGINTRTHKSPGRYWKNVSYETYVSEIVDMRTILRSHGIKNVVGFRSPFLQTSGDTLYAVLKDYGFLYDSSLATHFGQLWWPFTLDYDTKMNPCKTESCPKNSYPGLWEIPKVPLHDKIAECLVFEGCHRFETSDKEGVFNFLSDNFNRHYAQQRAPFNLFGHPDWMAGHHNKYKKEALIGFIQNMLLKNDVYFVTMTQAIEWMKNPTTLDNIKNFKPWSC